MNTVLYVVLYVVTASLTLATLLQGAVAFIELKKKLGGHPKIWLISTVICIVLAVISGFGAYKIQTVTDIPAFDFENGINGWSTFNGNTQLSVTSTPVYSGKQALEVNTQLSAPANIEVAVYFNQTKPAGSDSFGPYNFAGKYISCFLYLPDALAKEVFVQIFVKDTNSVLHHFAGTEYSQPFSTDFSSTGKWREISYQVGTGTPDPKGFNSTEVDAMGIRIETNTGSHLTFTGSFYIDDCTIKG